MSYLIITYKFNMNLKYKELYDDTSYYLCNKKICYNKRQHFTSKNSNVLLLYG